jgi:hypothetical protein
VPIAFRADLEPFLAEFIDHHRGLRTGRMFGLPAGYAGRKLFVCLVEDGLIVRLPEHIAKTEVRTGKGVPASGFGIRDSNRESQVPTPGRAGRTSGVWIRYEPRTAREASLLTPILEVAARHVVQTA